MTDFPTFSYIPTCEFPTLLYTWSLKKVTRSGGASPLSYNREYPPPPGIFINRSGAVCAWNCRYYCKAVLEWFSLHDVESNSRLLWFCFSTQHDWLQKNAHANLSSKQKKNQNQSWLACTLFSTLCNNFMYLLRVLIGSLDCLCPLWLARVIVLVLVLRHSIENRWEQFKYCNISL